MGTAPQALPALATGALAVGGFALGAIAVGAAAVGALAIGRLAVGRARIGRLQIDELAVRRLVVAEELHAPQDMARGPSAQRGAEQASSLNPTPIEVVREFWRLMGTNDFTSVAAVLGEDFVLEWPQSKERIRGADRFAQMNSEYVAYGRWRFDILRLMGSESEALSEVAVTDGRQNAKALSFFTVAAGKITRLVEYWPEPYPAPTNRAHLVEPME